MFLSCLLLHINTCVGLHIIVFCVDGLLIFGLVIYTLVPIFTWAGIVHTSDKYGLDLASLSSSLCCSY